MSFAVRFFSLTHSRNRVNILSACILKRFAGHSKWHNIKHDKAIMDTQRAMLFTKLSRQIKVAIQTGGGQDPDFNHKLASLIGQAKKANMPALSIKTAIKNAINSKDNAKATIIEVRGPNRCCILIEVLTESVERTKNTIASILKKYPCKYDNSAIHSFHHTGIITTQMLAGGDLETATDHAIESGAEEVKLLDDGRLQFDTSPEQLFIVQKKLEGLGYVVDVATHEYIPNIMAELNEDAIESLSTLLDKLQALPEVVKITDNIV